MYCEMIHHNRPGNIFRASSFWTSQIFLVRVSFYLKESFTSWRTFWDVTWVLFSIVSSTPSTKPKPQTYLWFSLLGFHYLFIWSCQFLFKNDCYKYFFSPVLLLVTILLWRMLHLEDFIWALLLADGLPSSSSWGGCNRIVASPFWKLTLYYTNPGSFLLTLSLQ